MKPMVFIAIFLANVVGNVLPKHAPVNIVIVFDESKSFRVNVPNYIHHYKQMAKFISKIFDVGWGVNQTRVAMLCTGYQWPSKDFFKDKEELVNDGFCSSNDPAYHDNLHVSLESHVVKLFDLPKRADGENITIVMTDGKLTDEEQNFPSNVEHLRSTNNLFFFYSRTNPMSPPISSMELEAMVNLTKRPENVIAFDIDDFETTEAKFFWALCNDEYIETSCERKSNDSEYNCMKSRRWSKGINSRPLCGEEIEWFPCDERICECDEKFPWSPIDKNYCADVACNTFKYIHRNVPSFSVCKRRKVACYTMCTEIADAGDQGGSECKGSSNGNLLAFFICTTLLLVVILLVLVLLIVRRYKSSLSKAVFDNSSFRMDHLIENENENL